MSDFEKYFSQIYKENWELLYASLKEEESQICFSPFTQSNLSSYLETPESYRFQTHEQATARHEQGHLLNYILDPASLAPVATLDIQHDDQILDLCAAPGGKSLALLSQLNNLGFLLSNDSSEGRYHRLRKVMHQYTPRTHEAQNKITNKDGTRFGFYYPQKFNKILIDVPCSSERHHIHQNSTQSWSLKKSKFLSVKQYTLLCSALLCAKKGATIVYSTCSINPVENDDVIAKFLKKKKDFVEVSPTLEQTNIGSTPTQYGQMILPNNKGFGPIYYSKLLITDTPPTIAK